MGTLTTSNELRQLQHICIEKNSPQTGNLWPSACRHCRFFKPQGRRGGYCQQIGIFVHGNWRACNLARPLFNVDVP